MRPLPNAGTLAKRRKVMTRITWLRPPLFTNAGTAEVSVGVAGDGWYVDTNPSAPASSERSAVTLLPLLQDGFGGPFEDVKLMLSDRLRTASLTTTLIATFPFQFIVLKALESTWWAERAAANWLDEIPWFPDGLQRLRLWASDDRLSQRLRHHLKKVLKRPHHSFREPARVLSHLDSGMTKVSLLRREGHGLAGGEVYCDLVTSSIPHHLRQLNTRLVITVWTDTTQHVSDFDSAEWAPWVDAG